MKGTFPGRTVAALNVSAAFHDCFFHCYALHVLANHLEFPDDLFTFKSVLPEDRSLAKRLQLFFPDRASLELYSEYKTNNQRHETSNQCLFEKTLILGCLLREWFATHLSENTESQSTLTVLETYITQRKMGVSSDVLDQAYLLSEDNKRFVEENLEQSDWFHGNELTAQGQAAIETHWQSEAGHLSYCQTLATPGTTVTADCFLPILRELAQPLRVENAYPPIDTTMEHDSKPILDMMLSGNEGHYYLCPTPTTQAFLTEYEEDNELYTARREAYLDLTLPNKEGILNDDDALKALVPNVRSTPLLPAILVSEGRCISRLLQKLEDIKNAVARHKTPATTPSSDISSATPSPLNTSDGNHTFSPSPIPLKASYEPSPEPRSTRLPLPQQPSSPRSATITLDLTPIITAMKGLKELLAEETRTLKKNGQSELQRIVENLSLELGTTTTNYYETPSSENYKKLTDACVPPLQQALAYCNSPRRETNPKNSVKQTLIRLGIILTNILSGIITLGLAQGINYFFTRKPFFFSEQFQTKRISSIQTELDKTANTICTAITALTGPKTQDHQTNLRGRR